jgi:hypothetical protein
MSNEPVRRVEEHPTECPESVGRLSFLGGKPQWYTKPLKQRGFLTRLEVSLVARRRNEAAPWVRHLPESAACWFSEAASRVLCEPTQVYGSGSRLG